MTDEIEITLPPSEEAPAYRKVQHQAGRLFMIICDEGWRTTILCDSMYEDDADWLIAVLGRQPRQIGPEDPGAELAALRERVGGLRASLDILAARAVPAGILTEDEVSAYWKDIGPGETLREQLDGLREQFGNLAAGLDLAAQSTSPSKKSEIERGCADAIRGILEGPE